MEHNVQGKPYKFPPFAQALVDRGIREGKLEGKLDGTRSTLARLLKRAGIELTDAQRARIETCNDLATIERWCDNVIGAKSAADVFGND